MPNLASQVLFCGSSRTIKVCDQFIAMCMVNWEFCCQFLLSPYNKVMCPHPFPHNCVVPPSREGNIFLSATFTLGLAINYSDTYRDVKCARRDGFVCMSFHSHEKNIYKVAADPK